MSTEYELIVGMEVHVELATESKVFCGCRTAFGAPPNTQVCPACLGMPGALPVLNRKAVELTIRAALALNCSIAERSDFYRKNYFYPDLTKGYQITQFDKPLGYNGYLDIEVDGQARRVRIKRVHLEEETGKALHAGDDIISAKHSLMDFNRGGIGLIEIVTEPDLRSADEARAYLTKLRSTLAAVGVSDCKMEEGSMRCEANISVRPRGSDKFGDLVEMKNIASFRAVHKAISYEAVRQVAVLEAGGKVARETRHWDDAKGETVFMRSKEKSVDYRYFPEPDMIPLNIDKAWVEEIRRSLPELPDARARRYVDAYGLLAEDAALIAESPSLTRFFEETVAVFPDGREVAKWLVGDVSAAVNASGEDLTASKLTPKGLGQMLEMIRTGAISGKIAKSVFEEMFSSGKMPKQIVEEKGLGQISDASEIEAVIDRVVQSNPGAVADYAAGKDKAITFLVGQVMKETRGRANPGETNRILKEKLQTMI